MQSHLRAVVAAFAALVPLVAGAQAPVYTHHVYIDADDDALTGCTVAVAEAGWSGGVTGVEKDVAITVARSATPMVSGITVATCSVGSFLAPAPVSAGGWPVALNAGVAGSDAVEGFAPRDVLAAGEMVRLYVHSHAASASDVLLASTGRTGTPLRLSLALESGIPLGTPLGLALLVCAVAATALVALRRRLATRSALVVAVLVALGVAAAAWAATIVMGSGVSDWSGIAPLGNDASGDSSVGDPAEDIVAAFATADGTNLYLRVDIAEASCTDGTYYRDADGDGYGDVATTTQACSAPAGYVADSTDCDDTRSSVYPGAAETCNGLDDDCDATTDEGFSVGEACTSGSGSCAGSGTIVCDPGGAGSHCGANPQPDGTACDDGDACTTLDACQGGSCSGAGTRDCDDHNPCTVDSCVALTGACVHVVVSCDDLDPCTTDSCDPASGQCRTTAAPDGAACDDGSACTQTDTCQAGACTGSNPVTCLALDQCHEAGACDPATGVCSNPVAPDGSSCNDANACTQTDTCQAGTCTGSDPVTCLALDQCHVAGTCDPATGTCSDPNAPDGAACDDGSGCASSDACSAGVCVGGSTPAESCNGLDDNCDGTVDEEGATGCVDYYYDSDGDGYGVGGPTLTGLAPTTSCLCAPSGNYQATQGGDCDDSNAAVNPDAEESCNGVDDDCEGTVDEGAVDASTFYADADGDGYGNAADSTAACSQPAGYVLDSSDCDDLASSIYPGAPETCNGMDDDCDGSTDEDATDASTYYQDSDGDGYGDPYSSVQACDQPPAYVGNAADCDDGNASVNPDAEESCNGADDDCDSTIDEDAVDASTFYADADGDGFGDTGSMTQACSQPDGYVSNDFDCDDTRSGVNPSAAEVCNGLDDNCDGFTDEDAIDKTTYYRDGDGDGYGDPVTTTAECSQPAGYVLDSSDCDDSASSIYPGAPETCNGMDDDCDGSTDEDAIDASTYYQDADGDGYGDPYSSGQACDQPPGYVVDSTDCDDSASSIYPDAPETCNGMDDDCDGSTDEDAIDASTYYQDADGDGQGTAGVFVTACVAPAGYVEDASDCDDSDASIYWGAPEECNGIDDNCDATVDEGCP